MSLHFPAAVSRRLAAPENRVLVWEANRVRRALREWRARLLLGQAVLLLAFFLGSLAPKDGFSIVEMLITAELVVVPLVYSRTTLRRLDPARLRDALAAGVTPREMWPAWLVAPLVAWFVFRVLHLESAAIRLLVKAGTDASASALERTILFWLEFAGWSIASGLALFVLASVPLIGLDPRHAIAFVLGLFLVPAFAGLVANIPFFVFGVSLPSDDDGVIPFVAAISLCCSVGIGGGYFLAALASIRDLQGPAYARRIAERAASA